MGGRVVEMQRSKEEVRKAAHMASARFKLVDTFLASTGNAYLEGASFSIADIPLGTETNRWMFLRRVLDKQPESTPALDAWYGRLVLRDAFRKGVLDPEAQHQSEAEK